MSSSAHITPPRRFPVGRWSLVAVCAVVGVLLVAPMLVVIPMSFTGQRSFKFLPSTWSTKWYENFFTDPDWYDSLLVSLRVALVVTVFATVLGTAAALGLDRSRFPGKTTLNAFVLSPMIVPVVVTGIAIYAVFLPRQLTGTTLGFVLAHCALAAPFAVVTVSASLRTFDRQLELAAASLGATPLASFFKVTLPLIRPGVLTGALFAFIVSFDELVVSLFLVTPEMRTLPVQMYSSVTREIDPTIAAASAMIMIFTTALLLLAFVLRPSKDGVAT